MPLKLILLPLVLIATIVLAMITHIVGTSFYRNAAWTPVTATVTRVQPACEISYQPADAILRPKVVVEKPCGKVEAAPLPDGASNIRMRDVEYGELTYAIDGKSRVWKGKLSDAGVYKAAVGAEHALVSNPADPQMLDSVAM